jgi:hypothetical protein
MKAILKKPMIFDGIKFKAGTYDSDNELTKKLFEPHWFPQAYVKDGNLILELEPELESEPENEVLQDDTESVEQKGKRGRKKKESLEQEDSDKQIVKLKEEMLTE